MAHSLGLHCSCSLRETISNASEFHALTAHIRGHHIAKSGVENALWDINAQIKRLSLAKTLGGIFQEITCGVSLGIQENTKALVARVAEELRAGYQRIKLKIKPSKDLEYVAAVRREFPDIQLSVDADCSDELYEAKHLSRFDEIQLTHDGAASQLGRYTRPCEAAEADRDSNLSRRVHPQRSARADVDRAPGMPHHQRQAGASWRTRRSISRTERMSRTRDFGLVRRHVTVMTQFRQNCP